MVVSLNKSPTPRLGAAWRRKRSGRDSAPGNAFDAGQVPFAGDIDEPPAQKQGPDSLRLIPAMFHAQGSTRRQMIWSALHDLAQGLQAIGPVGKGSGGLETQIAPPQMRSEERRVGKEGQSRWAR